MRRIFNSFVNEGKGEAAIAAELNADQIRNALGNHWQRSAVHDILINEKYAGNFVFNRSSKKLRRKWIANPPEMWIRHDGALSPIIEADMFANAQAIIAKRRVELSDQDMLDRLKLPGFRFHALAGRDRGRYAVNASGNWRITFGWLEGNAVDVDLEDHH